MNDHISQVLNDFEDAINAGASDWRETAAQILDEAVNDFSITLRKALDERITEMEYEDEVIRSEQNRGYESGLGIR